MASFLLWQSFPFVRQTTVLWSVAFSQHCEELRWVDIRLRSWYNQSGMPSGLFCSTVFLTQLPRPSSISYLHHTSVCQTSPIRRSYKTWPLGLLPILPCSSLPRPLPYHWKGLSLSVYFPSVWNALLQTLPSLTSTPPSSVRKSHFHRKTFPANWETIGLLPDHALPDHASLSFVFNICPKQIVAIFYISPFTNLLFFAPNRTGLPWKLGCCQSYPSEYPQRPPYLSSIDIHRRSGW